MNKAWITGLSLAGVVGTAGAAYAGFAEGAASGPIAAADAPVASQPHHDARTVSYQVGVAGTVTLTLADGSVTVSGATAGAGWVVLSSTVPGAHVEVQFSDSLQVVTFAADAAGDDIAVSLMALPADGAPTTVAGAPMDVTIITTPHHNNHPTPTPAPATPTPTPTPPAVTNPTAPPPSATTAPSGGEDDDDDDEHEDDHEDDEHEDDHEDEEDD
ncbi:MAG: hypothetical protein Q7V88_16455 [Actinomycetota bacterium]|nr:hypothetical protein [Actinomycetota bacterium]